MNRHLIISKLIQSHEDFEHLRVLWDNSVNDMERSTLIPEIQVAEKDIALYSALLFARIALPN